jgi:hypothetical protein
MEAKILVNVDGFGTSVISLDLVDPATEFDHTEVWCARFTEEAHPDEIIAEVYFEMTAFEYELWDLVNAALGVYHAEVE